MKKRIPIALALGLLALPGCRSSNPEPAEPSAPPPEEIEEVEELMEEEPMEEEVVELAAAEGLPEIRYYQVADT